MKFFIFGIAFVLSMNLFLSYKILPPCMDRCSACRNSLSSAKIQRNLECGENLCPAICTSVISLWEVNKNDEIIHFRKDEQDVCHTCVHLGHCNIDACSNFDTKISTIVTQAHEAVTLPQPTLRVNILSDLNKKFSDYYFNAEFVVRNIRNMIDFIQSYHKLYKYSLFVKDVYQQHLIINSNHILKLDGLEDKDIAMYITALNKINDFYGKITTAKIVLDVNMNYNAVDVSGFKKKLLDLMQFNEHVSSLTLKARHLGNIIKEKVSQNLVIIDQYLEKIAKQLKITHAINHKRFLQNVKAQNAALAISNSPSLVNQANDLHVVANNIPTEHQSIIEHQVVTENHATNDPDEEADEEGEAQGHSLSVIHQSPLVEENHLITTSVEANQQLVSQVIEDKPQQSILVSKKSRTAVQKKKIKELNSKIQKEKKTIQSVNRKMKKLKEKIQEVKTTSVSNAAAKAPESKLSTDEKKLTATNDLKTQLKENKQAVKEEKKDFAATKHAEAEQATRQLDKLYNLGDKLHNLVDKTESDKKILNEGSNKSNQSTQQKSKIEVKAEDKKKSKLDKIIEKIDKELGKSRKKKNEKIEQVELDLENKSENSKTLDMLGDNLKRKVKESDFFDRLDKDIEEASNKMKKLVFFIQKEEKEVDF